MFYILKYTTIIEPTNNINNNSTNTTTEIISTTSSNIDFSVDNISYISFIIGQSQHGDNEDNHIVAYYINNMIRLVNDSEEKPYIGFSEKSTELAQQCYNYAKKYMKCI